MDRYIVPNLIFSAHRSAVRSGEGQVTFSSPALISSTRSPVELTTSWTQGIDRIRWYHCSVFAKCLWTRDWSAHCPCHIHYRSLLVIATIIFGQ